jgi:hypothetical protein
MTVTEKNFSWIWESDYFRVYGGFDRADLGNSKSEKLVKITARIRVFEKL